MSPAPPTPSTAAAPLPDVQSSLEGISLMPAILDPDAAAVYKAFQEAGRPPYETVTPAEARELYLKGRVVSNPEPPELESVRPLAIPAPHGAIPARVYTPKTVRKTDGLRAMPGVLPRRRLGDRRSRFPRRGLPPARA